MYGCKGCETVFAVVILLFTLVPSLAAMSYARWVLAAVGAILLIHAFTCKKCMMCEDHDMDMGMKKKKRR